MRRIGVNEVFMGATIGFELGDAELHGHAIMQKVSHELSGRICLGAGIPYGAIKRLTAARLIAHLLLSAKRSISEQRSERGNYSWRAASPFSLKE
jgi:hypothetical protein